MLREYLLPVAATPVVGRALQLLDRPALLEFLRMECGHYQRRPACAAPATASEALHPRLLRCGVPPAFAARMPDGSECWADQPPWFALRCCQRGGEDTTGWGPASVANAVKRFCSLKGVSESRFQCFGERETYARCCLMPTSACEAHLDGKRERMRLLGGSRSPP